MANITYRKELKYLIDKRDYAVLKGRLEGVLSHDKNSNEKGGYRIHSVYFDDIRNTALFDKLAGIENRAKFRIRYYNDDTSFIKLEKKVKNNNDSYKLSCPMTLDQAKRAISGDIDDFINSDYELMREFFIASRQKLLKANVITDYYREAFTYIPSEVRITFDMDIRTALTGTDIFDKDRPLVPVMGPDQMLLEVKYNTNLPPVIRDILKCVNHSQLSCSKFTLCKKYITMNDWEVDRWA